VIVFSGEQCDLAAGVGEEFEGAVAGRCRGHGTLIAERIGARQQCI
jgi:hypothetical protein